MASLSQTDIQNRRAEVENALEKAQALVDTLRSELGDLDATERTFSRLTGAERRAPRTASRVSAPKAQQGQSKPKTATAMIESVIREMGRPLEPKGINDAIDAKGWGPVNRNAMRSRIFHLVHDGRLVKVGTAYTLPGANENPTGDDSEGNEPAGLFSPAQGGEARPGGGT